MSYYLESQYLNLEKSIQKLTYGQLEGDPNQEKPTDVEDVELY